MEPIRVASRPVKSSQPDELEEWEANQILRRKMRAPFESDFAYLSRFLYEETFSVNQSPGISHPPMFKGVPGLTPGGLISHFYLRESINNQTVETAVAMHPQGRTLREALSKLDNWRERMNLVDVVLQCRYAATFQMSQSAYEPPLSLEDNLIAKPQETMYPEDIDSIGYRLIKMLADAPEMLQKVKDDRLKQLVGAKPERELTLCGVTMLSWEKFSQSLFAEPASYNEPAVRNALSELLFLRTHPELQVFYKYLSPSGYINAAASMGKKA